MISDLFGKLRRASRKPPRVIVDRVLSELRAEAERFFIGQRRALTLQTLLSRVGARDLSALWERLARRPYPARTTRFATTDYDALFPGDTSRILEAAEAAMAHRVDLLGSGPTELGLRIDWHQDFKTGHRWPPKYFRDIAYNNLELPSDVKVPWELSRMQWLIPVGQAYLLTGNDRYASAVRNLLIDWIDSNPMGSSVNWSCTMDVALRAIVWTWFFHVFHDATSWRDEAFRSAFIRSLYLHGDFVERHIERSDINGNHYTADAAGMVLIGLFFGGGVEPQRWADEGWSILCAETVKQVHKDGVDFEASVPYHRLVTELFLLPALYRKKVGLPVDYDYAKTLGKMGRFTAAYTGPHGLAPVWGDADDARVLPFGAQPINDHRYLVDMITSALDLPAVPNQPGQASQELFWSLGVAMPVTIGASQSASVAFPDGGFYVMRGDLDHVFIDCGPIGLAGRGGHGHNDCLSFEATLAGTPLIVDCGAYVYTANFQERNRFRSTDYHNTPRLDDNEINRFIRPDYLWNMHYDAVPTVVNWSSEGVTDTFTGTHAGFQRIAAELRPLRTISLNKDSHELKIVDEIEGASDHLVTIPFHLHPSVKATALAPGRLQLNTPSASFICDWIGQDFDLAVEEARVSFRYGVVEQSSRLVFRRKGPLPAKLSTIIRPSSTCASGLQQRPTH